MRGKLVGMVASLALLGVLPAAPAATAAGATAGAPAATSVRTTAKPPAAGLAGAAEATCSRLATSGFTGTAVCPDAPVKQLPPDEVAIQAPIWVPGWCHGRPQGQWHNERFDACAVVIRNWSVIRYPDRVTVGSFRLAEYHYSGTLQWSNGWVQRAGFEMTNASGNTAGIALEAAVGCYWGSCRLESNQFPAVQSLTSAPQGTANYRMDLGPGQVAAAHTYLAYQLIKPDAYPSGVMWSVPPLNRCDNNTPGTPGFGCVFPDNFVPTMSYSRWGAYSELAAHIQEAQWSGLSGAPGGNPLTRLTDSGLQQANRDHACHGGYPRPPGRSCDEYPFASTWQGAYTSGTGGGPRTRDWCQVDAPVTDGPYGWSVCMIDEWQNSAGGSELGAWYVANRIISGDPFYVRIT